MLPRPSLVLLAVAGFLILSASDPAAQANPLVGVWSTAGQCRNHVTVFTAEGHVFEMEADRTQQRGTDVWSVTKGVYDVAAVRRRPPFRFRFATNAAMESLELQVTSVSASAIRAATIEEDMDTEEEVLRPFRWVRCPASMDDEWPY